MSWKKLLFRFEKKKKEKIKKKLCLNMSIHEYNFMKLMITFDVFDSREIVESV